MLLTASHSMDYPLCMKTDSQSWESMCRRCGLCCFEKLEDENGTVFFTSTPCRYLDVVSRECRIYERRFAINPKCIKLTPDLIRKLNWLHDQCGYRAAYGITRRKGNK